MTTGFERLSALAQGVQYGIKLRDLLSFYGVRDWGQSEINYDLDDVLMRIRDQIKAEMDEAKAAKQTSVSAYDLLPSEDREAVEWVRDHGGLAHVKDICSDFRAAVERLGIEWSESELHNVMDVLDRRLMPDGMEWPRFEDGTPVAFEDLADIDGDIGSIVRVIVYSKEDSTIGVPGYSIGILANGYVKHSPLESFSVRVKRPAPKVLDADGVEIELGDDLYSIEGGLKFHVSHIDRVSVKIATDAMFALDKWADPSLFTHRAPVIAADGKPLSVGETVWGTKGGSYHLKSVHDGKVFAHYIGGSFGEEIESAGGEGLYRLRADQLTHERPDSWEHLEHDAHKDCCDYFGGGINLCEKCPAYEANDCDEVKAADLVRRAKALAERDR